MPLDHLTVGPYALVLERPAEPEALLDEEVFAARQEFLPYWAELWPSATALAEHVATLELTGQRVLELGCGLGLVSIVAAKRGAAVLATDWAQEAVEATRANAERNGVVLEAAAIDWRAPAELAARGPFDLVLAADVLYEERNAAPLLEVLRVLGAPLLIAEPGRPTSESFFAALAGDAGEP